MKTADLYYIALKALEPEAYRKARAFAEGVVIDHNLGLQVAVAVESACILLACELLEVEP